MTKERLIEILRQILLVESIEVKNYSIESLIDQLEEDLNEETNNDR